MERFRPKLKPEEDYDIQIIKRLDCFDKVDTMIKEGVKYDDIIKFIQEESHELIDLEPNEIRRMLKKYRDSLLPGEIIKSVDANRFLEAIRKVEKCVDEIQELNRLYLLQMERIGIDFETEKRLGKLFKTTGTEIWYAMKILETMAQLKMDMGLLDRKPIEFNIKELVAHYEMKSGNVIPNREKVISILENPEARQKLLKIASVVEKITGKTVDKQFVDDGQNSIIIDKVEGDVKE